MVKLWLIVSFGGIIGFIATAFRFLISLYLQFSFTSIPSWGKFIVHTFGSLQIVDEEKKVMKFIESIHPILESMRYGCLVTAQQLNVLFYKPGQKIFFDL